MKRWLYSLRRAQRDLDKPSADLESISLVTRWLMRDWKAQIGWEGMTLWRRKWALCAPTQGCQPSARPMAFSPIWSPSNRWAGMRGFVRGKSSDRISFFKFPMSTLESQGSESQISKQLELAQRPTTNLVQREWERLRGTLVRQILEINCWYNMARGRGRLLSRGFPLPNLCVAKFYLLRQSKKNIEWEMLSF